MLSNLKESLAHLVIRVHQAIGGQLGLASYWLSIASQLVYLSALMAAASFGWATVLYIWKGRKKLTHKTWVSDLGLFCHNLKIIISNVYLCF